MPFRQWVFAATAVALVVSAPGVEAEGGAPSPRPDQVTVTDAPLKTMALSAELYARGVAAGDPLLVIAAAKLRRGLDLREEDAPAARPAYIPAGWDEMLDTARDLATGNDALLALIEDVAAEADKGVATGQLYSIAEIGTGATDTYADLPFKAGEFAEVYVESQDGSDLNVYVYDAAGQLVCADTDPSAISYCAWRPSTEGGFTIKVENRGDGTSGYALMTN